MLRKLKTVFFCFLCLSGSLFLAPTTSQAVSAYPGPVEIKQPDGHTIKATRRGGEQGIWYETSGGYTINKGKDGYWNYIRARANGSVMTTRYRAHLKPRAGWKLVPHVNPHARRFTRQTKASAGFSDSGIRRGDHQGKVLILSVEFPDQLSEYGSDVWASRIASNDPNARSLTHYYRKVSGSMAMMEAAAETSGNDNDGVAGPFMMSMNHPNNGLLCDGSAADFADVFNEAIAAVDPFIDFAAFDTDDNLVISSSELAIVLLTAGYTSQYSPLSPSVCASAHIGGGLTVVDDQSSTGETIRILGNYALIGEKAVNEHGGGETYPVTLGTFAHEIGHLVYGLPDLYDRNGSIGGESGGIGYYGLMHSSSGLDHVTDAYPGETPALMSAWSLLKLGWARTENNFTFNNQLKSSSSENALLTSRPVIGLAHMGKTTPTGALQCSAKEYFLIQYRTAEGYDRGLYAVNNEFEGESSGVVIYHVNENNADNDNAHRKLLDVEEVIDFGPGLIGAYGSQLWNRRTENAFNSFSTPNSHYDFQVITGQPGISPSRDPSFNQSGVNITVGQEHTDRLGIASIDLDIRTLCDVN